MTTSYVINEDSGKAVILKDPDAILDYPFDWTLWLAQVGDTISTATYILSGGLTLVSQNLDGANKIATPIVSGGVAGATESITCRIVTAAARKDDRTIYLKIKDR